MNLWRRIIFQACKDGADGRASSFVTVSQQSVFAGFRRWRIDGLGDADHSRAQQPVCDDKTRLHAFDDRAWLGARDWRLEHCLMQVRVKLLTGFRHHA